MSVVASDWLQAFRLRTLPLAAASILLGSALALQHGYFRWEILLLSLLTAFAYQILSNLANDYGDYSHGADSDDRIGPARAVQSGAITPGAMRGAIRVAVVVSIALTVGVSVIGAWRPSGIHWPTCLGYGAAGLICVAAAITYTAGRNPYGYRGFGDLAVYIFFGLAGVAGTWFLHSGEWRWSILAPASTMGLFCTGVLNLNNLRDHENDAANGKNTLVVQMGYNKGKGYHYGLILGGWSCAYIYLFTIGISRPEQLLFSILLPIFVFDLVRISHIKDPVFIDPFLKRLAISTLLFSLGFGICIQFR